MAKIVAERTGQGMTERVRRLRERVVVDPEICTERAWLMTESYKETEGEPILMRRAKALKKMLAEMTVRIDEDELIVGTMTSKIRGAPILPEIQWEWILDEMETLSTRPIDKYAPMADWEKSRIKEMLPYWKGKALFDQWKAKVPPDLLRHDHKIQATGGYCENGHHPAHSCINHAKVLAMGLKGVKAEVEQELTQVDVSEVEGLKKHEFLTAANMTLDAAIGFAKRYADLARSKAAKETNPRRKAELEMIAKNLEQVPANPARNFYEALQAIWLVWCILMIEGFGAGMTMGRADQYLYPFYKKDIESGVLTEEQARELIALLYIKMNSVASVENKIFADCGGGFPIMVGVTLGGVTPKGKDAVNELSYVLLDVDRTVGLTQEEVIIRVHHNTPEAFLIKACEVAKELRGKLKFIGDETTISGLLAEGKPIEYARDYTSTGCHTCHIPGKSRDIGGVTFNIAIMVELALNNGAMRMTGEQLGPKTGDPRKFKSYEEVWEAYRKQLEYAISVVRTYKNIELELQAGTIASPFQSSLYDDCIKVGRDITNGGTAPYQVHLTSFTGMADTADSLAAVKKVVFDDKKVTMSKLIDALDKNFEGFDDVRHLVSNAPKFGNDDDYVDTIMMAVNDDAAQTVSSHISTMGFKNVTSAQSMTANMPLGALMGALPDGRKAGEPLAECISPHQGRSSSGPTATLRSVAKIDHAKMTHGSILNMRFNPDALKDDQKIKKFAALLRTFFETGGDLVQFNIIDAATLRAAQKNPDKYRDLIVRVATYSAYFVELGKEAQDDIIARTEFENV